MNDDSNAHTDVGGSDDDAGTDARQARTSEGGSIDVGIARELSELARTLEHEPDPRGVMQRIVDAAVVEIGGAVGAAITLVDQGRVSSPVHSSAQAGTVGQAQADTGQGPCVDTARDELTYRSDDLRQETRWPLFTAVALDNGIESILSFQLFVEDDKMGALDVYCDKPYGFDDDAESTGLLLASHAAIAMSADRRQTHLRTALGTRDLIGQAKGILMERYKIDGGRAFDLIVLSSQNTNSKVRDIADHLVTSGELLTPDRRRGAGGGR